MTAEPAYMDRRAAMYLREWSETAIGNTGMVSEVSTACHRRLERAGLVKDYDGRNCTLTSLGMYIVECMKEMGNLNFFTIPMLLDIWPLFWLQEASARSHKLRETPSEHTIINFLAVFQLEFPLDEPLKEYMRARSRASALDPADPSHLEPLRAIPGNMPLCLVQWPDRPSVDFTVAQDVAGDFAPDSREMTTGDLSQYITSFSMEITNSIDPIEKPEITGDLEVHGEVTVTFRDEELLRHMEAQEEETCSHCDGSKVDPFDDNKPCPVCQTEQGPLFEPAADDDEWDIL